MPDPITRALKVLNEALERDAEAMTRLVNLRVECSERLSAHPTIQVGLYGGVYRLGVLGLVNGILGAGPSGAIGAKGRRDSRTGLLNKIHKFVDLRKEKTDLLA